jgi:alpha/beta superfamily hydrolase
MYRQVFIPTEQNSHIAIPREWYGQEVEIIVFPIAREREKPQPPVDYTDIQQVLKTARKEDVQEIKKIFANHLFSMKDFKFNRDEANNYE